MRTVVSLFICLTVLIPSACSDTTPSQDRSGSSSHPRAKAGLDCSILESHNVGLSQPGSLINSIGYDEAVMLAGLGLSISKELRNEASKEVTIWKTSVADNICRGLQTEISLEEISTYDMTHLAGQPDAALLTDMRILRSKDGVSCQLSRPNDLLNKDECNVLLRKLTDVLGLPEVDVNTWNITKGVHHIYVYSSFLSHEKPEKIVCRSSNTPITSAGVELERLTLMLMESLGQFDTSFGTNFILHMEEAMKKCGAVNMSSLLNLNISKVQLESCFGLSRKTSRNKRLAVFSFGSGTNNAQMIEEINKNFGSLSLNQKSLMKKLLTMKIETDLESSLLESQDKTLKMLDRKVSGLEVMTHVMYVDKLYLSQMENSALRIAVMFEELNSQIDDFKEIVEKIMETSSDLHCSHFICYKTDEVHLLRSKNGLQLYAKTKALKAEAGYTPSCRFNDDEMISRFHLKHLKAHNDTFLTDGVDLVERKCLERYQNCPKSLLRPVSLTNDLIQNNVLISPAKDGAVFIQCIKNTIVKTSTSYIQCGRKRSAAKLPLYLADNTMIGAHSLKLHEHHTNLLSLRNVETFLLTTHQKIQLAEMKNLGHQMWNSLTNVQEVNSHHGSLAIGITIGIALLVSVLCIGKCVWRLWKSKGGPCHPGKCLPLPDRINCWKRKLSVTSTETSTAPSAPAEGRSKDYCDAIDPQQLARPTKKDYFDAVNPQLFDRPTRSEITVDSGNPFAIQGTGSEPASNPRRIVLNLSSLVKNSD